MPISVAATRDALAAAYAAAAPFSALFSADPGTTVNVTGELLGGSPAYARKPLNWGAPVRLTTAPASKVTGTATHDVPSGTTVTYAGVCATGVAGTADLRDRSAVTPQTFSSQGFYNVSDTYTQQ